MVSCPGNKVSNVYKPTGFSRLLLLRPRVGVQLKSVALDVETNCNGWPTTAEVSLPANTLMRGRTVISKVSVTGLGQPSVSDAVSTNAVVCVRLRVRVTNDL